MGVIETMVSGSEDGKVVGVEMVVEGLWTLQQWI